MPKPVPFLLGLALLLAQIGCSDTSTDPENPDNLTVAEYSGPADWGGMNVSAIYFNGSANSFVVQEDVTFLAKRLPTAMIRSVDSGGRDQTIVQLQTNGALIRTDAGGFLEGSIDADVTVSFPGDSTGTFTWVSSSGFVDVGIRFIYGTDSVAYDDVVSATVTVVRIDKANGDSRYVQGTFSAILTSPEGMKIGVKGMFDTL